MVATKTFPSSDKHLFGDAFAYSDITAARLNRNWKYDLKATETSGWKKEYTYEESRSHRNKPILCHLAHEKKRY
jgi:hypothetical protein